MRWVFLIFLAVLLVRFGPQWMPDRSDDGPQLVKWVAAEEGLQLARSSGKPVLYDFTAAWCPPCRQLDREVFMNEEMARRINHQFVPVRVMDRQREDGRNGTVVAQLQKQYSIGAFPTVVIAEPSGALRTRIEGYGGARAFGERIGLEKTP